MGCVHISWKSCVRAFKWHAGENNNSNQIKGEDHDDDMHSSKHAEDLPAPDTPAAVKDAGSKYVYLNVQKPHKIGYYKTII